LNNIIIKKHNNVEILNTVAETRLYLDKEKKLNKTIGFVPTMGALHQGHLELVKQARKENDVVVVSIFVNPIQFNNKEDLEKYPRTFENDAALLESVGCDLIFYPTVKEMYPEPDTTIYDFGNLDKVMEGKHRPGHFNGVAIVVKRLFDIINPDKAYFGEKDFQQLAIVKAMVAQLNLPVIIIPCETVREKDGLAMSSRNTRLEPNERNLAPFIYLTLSKAKEKAKYTNVKELEQWVVNEFNKHKEFKIEYFEIVDSITLQPINDFKDKSAIGCIAVFMGDIRLIDNIKF